MRGLVAFKRFWTLFGSLLVTKTRALYERVGGFQASGAAAGPPPEQDIPLNVPKKTKLYVEQTQREREQAVDMHRIFQRDLCKLRLSTARAYVKVLTDGQGSVSYTTGSSLRLNVQVQVIQTMQPVFHVVSR
jgi:Bardet-Biedl syndrome 1 protein